MSEAEKFNFLSGELKNILFGIHNNLFEDLFAWNRKWNLIEAVEDDVNQLKKRSLEEFEKLMIKLERKEKKCIVFGDTSAGKSTLINAILGLNDLPTGYGTTTKCVIQIQQSPDDKTYFNLKKIDVSKSCQNAEPESYSQLHENSGIDQVSHSAAIHDFNVSLMKDMILEATKDHLQSRSYIDLFYKRQDCPFLSENFVIIDTPGIDIDEDLDEDVARYCDDADLIIFIVNSTSWINNTMVNFIKRFESTFSKMKIFLVFNHWDRPDNRNDRDMTRKKFLEMSKELFREKFEGSVEVNENNIFFLCAEEQITNSTTNETVISNNSRRQTRKKDFSKFMDIFKKEMNESSLSRKWRYLCELNNIVKENTIKFEGAFNHIHDTMKRISKKQVEEFNSLDNLNDEIGKNIELILTLSYKRYIEAALLIITEEALLEDIHNQNNRGRQFDNQQIRDLHTQTKTENLEKLKSQIIDKLKERNDEYLPLRIMLIEKIFFSYCINDVKKFDLHTQYQQNINQIKSIINNAKYYTTNGSGLFGFAGSVAGISMSTAIPISVIPLTGIAVLSACTGAILLKASKEIIKRVNQPFWFLWKRENHEIEKLWHSEYSGVRKLFQKFTEEIESGISQLFAPLQSEYERMREELSDIQAKIDRL